MSFCTLLFHFFAKLILHFPLPQSPKSSLLEFIFINFYKFFCILQIPDFPPTHLVLFGISLRIPFAIFPLRFWKRPVFKAFFEILSFFKAFFLLFFFSLKQEKPCGRLGSATRFLGFFCLFFSLFLYFHTAVVKDKETALYGGFAKWNSQKNAKRGCEEIF